MAGLVLISRWVHCSRGATTCRVVTQLGRGRLPRAEFRTGHARHIELVATCTERVGTPSPGTMRHAIETNAGGVGGSVQIITLQKEGDETWKGKELDQAEVRAHEESLNDLEAKIGEWRAQFTTAPTAPASGD